MLPRYRRLVEQLAQAGLLKVICGTDTLGVGINVPIRTVLFTGLAKYDGTRQRLLRAREFHQIAGRAGRAGLRHRRLRRRAGARARHRERAGQGQGRGEERRRATSGKKKRKAQLQKPPEGTVVWTEQTFDKLVAGAPEPLVSPDAGRQRDAAQRRRPRGGRRSRCCAGCSPTTTRTAAASCGCARRALRLARSLVRTGVLDPARRARRVRPPLRADRRPARRLRAQPAAGALRAGRLRRARPRVADYALDVVSVVEAVLEAPRQILMAQQHAARGEAVGEMKADGIEYDERMALLDEVTWPQPLARAARARPTRSTGRRHPWLPEDALSPKSVVREMYEQGMTFTEFVGRYQLARSEGLVLRYLTDAYRTLRQTVPDAHRTAGARRPRRVAGGDRAPDRLLAARRVGGADRPRGTCPVATGWPTHAPPPPPRPISGRSGRSG